MLVLQNGFWLYKVLKGVVGVALGGSASKGAKERAQGQDSATPALLTRSESSSSAPTTIPARAKLS